MCDPPSVPVLQNLWTRAQVEALVAAGRLDELRSRLCSRMSFGTAGLRAPMGAGFSRINDLTVIQSTQVCVQSRDRRWPRPSSP